METLGERIKKLRKEKGLTLQALAGSGLTKGMLSLIENNKANPSMESLTYIAERLEVDKNELLEEVSTAELRELLEKVERLYRVEIATEELLEEYRTISKMIQPYIKKLPYRYETARLLEIYSRCSYHSKTGDWQFALQRAEEIYEDLHMINQIADIHSFKIMTVFSSHQYAEALSLFQESRKSFQEKVGELDSLRKLDFDYFETILYSAVGDGRNAYKIMQKAVEYSKENQIFYRVNDLYRFAGFQAILNGDVESKNYYIGKLRLFADFSDDENIEAFADAVEIHYLNSFAHEYKRANEMIDQNLEKHEENTTFTFTLEKGKALYGMGQTEEALVWLKKHKTWEFLHHPYDLSMHYEKDAYLALIYEQQGKHELAVKHAQIAKDNIDPMPDLPYKTFILDVYQKITQ